MFIFDEPTTDLHFEDVRCLLEVLHTPVDSGDRVPVIEHSLECIVKLGQEGDGHIDVTGTPEVAVM